MGAGCLSGGGLSLLRRGPLRALCGGGGHEERRGGRRRQIRSERGVIRGCFRSYSFGPASGPPRPPCVRQAKYRAAVAEAEERVRQAQAAYDEALKKGAHGSGVAAAEKDLADQKRKCEELEKELDAAKAKLEALLAERQAVVAAVPSGDGSSAGHIWGAGGPADPGRGPIFGRSWPRKVWLRTNIGATGIISLLTSALPRQLVPMGDLSAGQMGAPKREAGGSRRPAPSARSLAAAPSPMRGSSRWRQRGQPAGRA